MAPSGISDQTSPDSSRIGGWLFRHRTSIPLPFALALLLVRTGEAAPALPYVAAGVVITGIGEFIRFAAVHHIGAISRTRAERLGPLIDTGPFGVVRNPLYIGNILIWLGFALTARLVWMAPVVVLAMGAEYHAIVRWEEQLLASKFGDAYRDYCARVPRWLPAFGTAGTRRADAAGARFSWRDTLFSERGTLIAVAAGYVLLWVKARF